MLLPGWNFLSHTKKNKLTEFLKNSEKLKKKLKFSTESEMKVKKMNIMEELSVNIEYCPYCGSEDINREDEVDCNCNECGRDFRVMTHE